MDGWLVHGERGSHAASRPIGAHRKWGALATPAAKAITGEVRINHKDKPTPISSLPGNWSAFSDREVLPWPMCRADAAATLRRARNLRARGQVTISVEAIGRYRFSAFNTLILKTRRC